ncbi:hypothetical protein [Brevibacterium album]|uniref:hypothetical protein n=1 Tax=Brevibacterium album TaxID=417948 RepID=UPI0003FCB025|nr:hypothetical protein [Brevibacterium album]
MLTKTFAEDLPQSADCVFAALEAVAGEHTVTARDPEARTLEFRTARSLFSWGHVVTAHVRIRGRQSSLCLTVSGVPGAPQALLDGKKNRSLGRKVLTALHAAL